MSDKGKNMVIKKYLIRLDDACPTMDRVKWRRMEEILERYGVKPMVGVIPHNEDPEQQIDPEDYSFWYIVKEWEKRGWAIALHGYNHCYTSDRGKFGMNPIWDRSEFSGNTLEVQREKIRRGVSIMRENGINPKFFFAPSHTFDENTLNALREESDIRIISDTIATQPYRYKDFVIIPQFSGQCREMLFPGLFTFCLHPSTMNELAFDNTERFLEAHYSQVGSFDMIDTHKVGRKSLIDCILNWAYFFRRNRRSK